MTDTPKTLSDWRAHAAALSFRTQAFIDGAFVDAADGRTFETTNPANETVITRIARCSDADVDRAVLAARRAFQSRALADMAPEARKALLLRAADLMEARAADFAVADCLEVGKPIRFAQMEFANAVRTFRWYAEAIDKVYGQAGPVGNEDISIVVHEPIGVIGAVVPWNFPMLLTSWKVAPALAAGNSVVLKPAEQSSLSALLLAEVLHEAGLPNGSFNVVTGFGPEVGQPLGLHDDVNMITFTGSTATGKRFLTYSGQSNMKRVSTECGGKSPHIVMSDAPCLEEIAESAVAAIFYNQGEVCTAGSRLFVQKEIYDEILPMLVDKAAAWRVGDPLDPQTNFGPLVDGTQCKTVTNFIEEARGTARVLVGGDRPDQTGHYVNPTIFADVDNASRLAQEEIFGPVLAVIPFDTLDDALRMANTSRYGLASAIWTQDISAALKAAKRLEAGMVWINAWDPDNITVPFGGFKESGIGRDRALDALHKYTESKSIWIKV